MLASLTDRVPRSSRGATNAAAALVVGVGLVYAYGAVVAKLVRDWAVNDNYSHGFLIVPIAAYLVWERRARLLAAPLSPSLPGLGIALCGLAMLAAGTLGAELFVARISLLVVLAGAIAYIAGWRHLRILAFPLAFLLLMIPIPAIVFNEIAFPLQILASQLGESALRAMDIPVLRQGNILTLANTTLEVADACSGIRSLVSLLTLSIVYAYFTEPVTGIRALLAASTVPIAIITNGARVAALGIAAYYYGPAATEGPFHSASGWLVFVLALTLMVALHRTIRSIRVHASGEPMARASATPGEVDQTC